MFSLASRSSTKHVDRQLRAFRTEIEDLRERKSEYDEMLRSCGREAESTFRRLKDGVDEVLDRLEKQLDQIAASSASNTRKARREEETLQEGEIESRGVGVGEPGERGGEGEGREGGVRGGGGAGAGGAARETKVGENDEKVDVPEYETKNIDFGGGRIRKERRRIRGEVKVGVSHVGLGFRQLDKSMTSHLAAPW